MKAREQTRVAKEEQRARQREKDAAVLAGASGARGGGGGGTKAAKGGAGAGAGAAKGVSSADGESEALVRFALVFVEVLAWCVFWSSMWVGGFNLWFFVGRSIGSKGGGGGATAAVAVPPAVPHSRTMPGAAVAVGGAAVAGVAMPPPHSSSPRSDERGEFYESAEGTMEDPGIKYVEVEAGGLADEAGSGGATGSGA